MTTDNGIIYLDNAATTFPKPEVVYQQMDDFYRHFGGNAGRGANPLARKAASLVDETRALVCDWLDAPAVVFSPSATIALNTVIQGSQLRAGDVVYVTPFEHNSVLRPLEHLRKTVGIEIRLIPFDRQTYLCDLAATADLFRIEPPTMVCVTQVSNVLGIASPVEDILAAARKVNPSVVALIDGAQAAGLHPLDMSQVDALIFSGHKSLYGPYGIAGIAFGTNWRPDPLVRGGTGTQSETVEMPANGVSRFEAGSQNVLAMAGLNAAVKWLKEIGRDTIVHHTNFLITELSNELQEVPGITVYRGSETASGSGILSFSKEGILPQAVETALGAQGIAVRAGLHCAPWAHEFAGTMQSGGTIRVSIGYFNGVEDLDSTLSVLKTLVGEQVWNRE